MNRERIEKIKKNMESFEKINTKIKKIKKYEKLLNFISTLLIVVPLLVYNVIITIKYNNTVEIIFLIFLNFFVFIFSCLIVIFFQELILKINIRKKRKEINSILKKIKIDKKLLSIFPLIEMSELIFLFKDFDNENVILYKESLEDYELKEDSLENIITLSLTSDKNITYKTLKETIDIMEEDHIRKDLVKILNKMLNDVSSEDFNNNKTNILDLIDLIENKSDKKMLFNKFKEVNNIVEGEINLDIEIKELKNKNKVNNFTVETK